ncbi:SRPBCC family protein [Oricola sp.]|uniref:SRPBCC family protein n=1 Tax=Oricola sp. TaxID=1979950 RepID=UPI003BAD7DCB
MTDRKTDLETEASNAEFADADELVQEYELDAPPEKIWRAITVPALREAWLPGKDLVEAKPEIEAPGEQVCYRMRDSEPPNLESVVRFHLKPEPNGGTILKIVQHLTDNRLGRTRTDAANGNEPALMLAA